MLVACGGAEPPVAPRPPSPPTASARVAVDAGPPPWRSASGDIPRGSVPLPTQGHLAGVRCLAFSPDGRLLVSGSDDRSLLVWDVESGAVVQRFDGHSGEVEACVFFSGDRVISGGYEDFSHMWDARSGKEEREVGRLASLGESTRAVAVSATGRELLVALTSGRVQAYDLDTDQAFFTVDSYSEGGGVKGPLVTAGYLSDGRAFTGGYRAKTIVWGTPSVVVDVETSSGVALPNGGLALGTWEGIALVRKERVERTIRGHTGWVGGLAASPGGDQLLAGDSAGRGRIWHLPSGKARCTLDGAAAYQTAAWSPTGEHVAIAGRDGAVYVGEASACADGKTLPLRAFRGARAQINAVAVGREILLGDGGGSVSAWDPRELHVVHRSVAHAGETLALAALPGGKWLSSGLDRVIALGGGESSGAGHEVSRAGPDQPLPLPRASKVLELDQSVRTLVALPGGSSALLGIGSEVRRIAVPSGVSEQTWTGHYNGRYDVNAIALEPGGAGMIVGDDTSTVRRLVLDAKSEGHAFTRGEARETRALAFLAAGGFVQLGRGRLLWWNMPSTREPGNDDRPVLLEYDRSLFVAPDALAVAGDQVWAGNSQGMLFRWTPKEGARVDRSQNEAAPVRSLAVTEGGFLVAGLGDGRASVRKLPDGELVAHLIPCRDGSAATVFAEGRYVSSTGECTQQHFVDPATGHVRPLGGGQPGPARWTTPRFTTLADGSQRVQATLVSGWGPPVITLDQGLPVEAITPGPAGSETFSVAFQLRDASAGHHVLRATLRNKEVVEAAFDVPPDPRAEPSKARALLIANGAYEQRPALPGAAKDLAAMRAFVTSDKGWKLAPDHVESFRDLRASGESGLQKTIADFLARAAADETLLVHISGLGESDDTQGFLLPVDVEATGHAGALSVTELGKLVAGCRAARVVVVLDASRAGRFLVPPELALSPRALMLVATDHGASVDRAAEAPFTQALLAALDHRDAVEPDRGAITLGRLFRVAASKATAEAPLLHGSGPLLDWALAWSLPAKLEKRATGPAKGLDRSGLRRVVGTLIAAESKVKSLRPDHLDVVYRPAKLDLSVVLDERAEALAVSVLSPAPTQDARAVPAVQRFERPRGGAWAKGQTVGLSIGDLRWDRGARVTVRACSGASCGSPVELELPLPPPPKMR
jgi:WD40 repeat protein